MRTFLIALILAASTSVSAQTFTSTAGGPIPDGTAPAVNSYGAPLDVPIVVSGITQGTIDTVSIAFSANHTWVGDLEVTLVSPYGQEHLLFARTGATTAGDPGSPANLVATSTYTFNDPATSNWWTLAVLTDTASIPSGSARTVISGGAGVTSPPDTSSILGVFQRRPPNGTWILRFRDGAEGDIGNVTSASITLSATGTTRTVTKIEDTNDGVCDADCSLREAIAASSDGATSVDRIEFARPFFDTPRRIVLNSNLNTLSPVFAWVGPGAPSLTISGRGLYSMQFGASGGTRSFAGTRISEVTGFSAAGTPLLHGMEFAFVNGRIGFPSCEINDTSIHSSAGGAFDQINLFGPGSSTFRRVTISQNTVRSASVAATIFSSGNLAIIDSTIVQNQATGQDAIGGILSRGVVRLQNSVVAGNRANGTARSEPDLGSRDGGTFQSSGHNAIGDVGSFATSFGQAGDRTGTTAAPLNPVLSPLSRHGGLIPVHVPMPGSPLLDQGRRIGRDVRGVALVDLSDLAPATGGNNGDIGAVELSPLLVTSLSDSGAGSLRQAILSAPPDPAVSDILFAGSFPPAAKITLTTGELQVDKNLSIHGFGAKSIAISGNQQSGVLSVSPNRRVSLSGVTLADGNVAIAQNLAGSQLSMVGVVLRGPFGWAVAGSGEFVASTIVGGGAIVGLPGSSLLLDRATLSGAQLRSDGEVSVISSTQVSELQTQGRTLIRNSILTQVSTAGLRISAGHNVVGATSSAAFSGPGDQVGTPAAPIDVRLSPLAFHGGPVPTHVPLAGSPALDKGLRFGVDAREQRLFDVTSIAAAAGGDNGDIGAVEVQAIFVTNVNDSGAGSLRQAVIDANASTALDDVLFDLPVPSTIGVSSRLPNPIAGGVLNLLGSGAGADRVTLSGGSASQLFSFTAPGHLSMSRLNLVNFRGVDGPALEVYQSEVHLSELEVRGNSASRDGGAILIGDADATIQSSTFANNSAQGDYGALAYLGSSSRLQVRGSTFSGNSGTNGSAIANVARDAGASVLELESVTLAENDGSVALLSRATSTGAATSSARNTLFSGVASSISTSGAPASFTSLGFNLSATSEPLLNQATDRVNVNPNLGPLLPNGGGTRTHAVIIPSAAIDAGIRTTGLALDQRGSSRWVNLPGVADGPGGDGTDIGAFELQSSPDNPPILLSNPPAGSTISYSGAGTAAAIVVSAVSGSGSGLAATSTFGACTISGGGLAFPTTTTAQLTFVGAAPLQNLNLPNCVPQDTVVNATLTCPVVRGPNPPSSSDWTLNCPVTAADPIFLNGFE